MKKLLVIVAVLGTVQPAAGQSAKLLKSSDAIPGRYIVVFKDNAAASGASASSSRPAVASLASAFAGQHGGDISHLYQYTIKGYAARMSEAQAMAVAADERVAFVEEDGIASVLDVQTNPANWGLDRIDQRSLPLNLSYSFRADGTGVHAYVIDTGILTTHSDFRGRATSDFNGVNDGNTGDCNGHGTHVAGTLGSRTWGVAKNVRLHAVRVFGCQGGSAFSVIIAGVEFVTEHHAKPAVANMSLSGGVSTALNDAVRASVATGITYVVAAGNNNGDACARSPAGVAQAITVGATTRTDSRASFSNFGTCVQIFAPGQGIVSAVPSTGNLCCSDPSGAKALSGTSMASPHVAGVAALHLQVNPTATPLQVSQAILGSATPNKVGNAGPGSPNLLLYNPFVDLSWLVPTLELLLSTDR